VFMKLNLGFPLSLVLSDGYYGGGNDWLWKQEWKPLW
jgi:hypothetical protein